MKFREVVKQIEHSSVSKIVMCGNTFNGISDGEVIGFVVRLYDIGSNTVKSYKILCSLGRERLGVSYDAHSNLVHNFYMPVVMVSENATNFIRNTQLPVIQAGFVNGRLEFDGSNEMVLVTDNSSASSYIEKVIDIQKMREEV